MKLVVVEHQTFLLNLLRRVGHIALMGFLYTDDEENSSTQWGQYDAGDKTYGSANYGITDLPLKEGKTYIFKIGVSNW